MTTVKEVAAGNAHSIVLKTDGTVWAFGRNNSGQLGNNSLANVGTPIQVQRTDGLPFTGLKNVSAGLTHSVAVMNSDGTVWTWGGNHYGQLGIGSTTQQTRAVQVLRADTLTALSGVQQVAAGDYHNLALTTTGDVWAWGHGANGELGITGTVNQTKAVKITGLSGVIAIAAGANYSVAVTNTGVVLTWGYNGQGQLGLGDRVNREVPVVVTGLTGVTAAAAGTSHTLALSGGNVWSWGSNSSGQLGDNTWTQRLSPVAVATPGFTGVTAIAASGNHSMALSNTAAVWTWGVNSSGELGIGTIVNQTKPVQILGWTASKIAAGGAHNLAIRASDQSLMSWGSGLWGQLGDGMFGYVISPVQATEVDLVGF